MMADEFPFDSADAQHTAQYLSPPVLRILSGENESAKTSIFDRSGATSTKYMTSIGVRQS